MKVILLLNLIRINNLNLSNIFLHAFSLSTCHFTSFTDMMVACSYREHTSKDEGAEFLWNFVWCRQLVTNKLSNLKSLDGTSVDRTDCANQNSSNIMWKCICQSQIEASQSLRTAYINDIKLVHYLNRKYMQHLCYWITWNKYSFFLVISCTFLAIFFITFALIS